MKLITILYEDLSLVPFFVEHYAVQGVTEFLVGAYQKTGAFDAARQLFAAHRNIIVPIAGEYSNAADTDIRHELCRRYVRPDEWWVVADVDEFHEYPIPLLELCEELDQRQYKFLLSRLLDRISADGSCPRLTLGVPLWEQFPAAAFITRELMASSDVKVMLVRGRELTGVGHHIPVQSVPSEIYVGGMVHHFKWFGDIVAKMKARSNLIESRGWAQPNKCDRLLEFWGRYARLPIAGECGFHFPTKAAHWPAITPCEGRGTRPGAYSATNPEFSEER
jgi:hypothetical protein